jgi:hypothetical protein
MPERTSIRIEQEHRATGTRDLFLGKVAECLQDVGERTTRGDHLKYATLPFVRRVSYRTVAERPKVFCWFCTGRSKEFSRMLFSM